VNRYLPELIQHYDVKYVGGHVEYPKPMDCTVYVYNDRIELENPNLVIPYRFMDNIENMDEKRISAKRVVALGLVAFPLAIVGALWKKNHIYTVIQYKDQVDQRTIILDFDENVEHVQRWIYRRMISFRQSPSLIYAEKGFLIYENEQYGFRMKYPDTWIEDELNEKTEEYVTLVEFRKVIENKAPFVTVYVNNLGSKYKSLGDFVDEQIQNIKNDSTTAIVERSNVMINGNQGIKLIDVDKKLAWDDHDVYKRMTVWIFGTDKVYEISYSTKEAQYNEYLPTAERIIDSFQFMEGTTRIQTEWLESPKSKVTEEPLIILKRRFASGEINEEEYSRMLRLLED
jgi:hypothetical protein